MDVFWAMAWVSLAAILVVMLAHKPKAAPQPGGGGH